MTAAATAVSSLGELFLLHTVHGLLRHIVADCGGVADSPDLPDVLRYDAKEPVIVHRPFYDSTTICTQS